jgi:hypothetical protein
MRDAVYSGYAVGFAANCKWPDGSLSLRFPPDSSEAHLMEMMRAMASMIPYDGASFASLLEHDLVDGMSDTEVVIFCYFQGEEMLTRIAELERLGNSVKIVPLEAVDRAEEVFGREKA